MKIGTSVAGVCVVRDAVDLVELSCGHYLRSGFGHVTFIDDGSSDGTYDLLSALSLKEARLSVRRVIGQTYPQEEIVSCAASELAARGFTTIVPFDIDEVWVVNGSDLEKRLAKMSQAIFRGRWVNLVQTRGAEYPTRVSLFGMKYRIADVDGDRVSITSFEKPFVSYVTTKVGCKTSGWRRIRSRATLACPRWVPTGCRSLRNAERRMTKGVTPVCALRRLRPAWTSSGKANETRRLARVRPGGRGRSMGKSRMGGCAGCFRQRPHRPSICLSVPAFRRYEA
jgi:hypothetical protein